MIALLLFVPSAVALVAGLNVLAAPRPSPDEVFGDGHEEVWDGLFRVHAWVAMALGAAGVALAVAVASG